MAHPWIVTDRAVCPLLGLEEGRQTAKPTPVFTRLDQDFVTEPPKRKSELAAAAS